jgi:hypothetical protein
MMATSDWDRRDHEKIAERCRTLHPRVGVGNYKAWTSNRTIYGPTIDGRYAEEQPTCRTFEGALKKAEFLSRHLFEARAEIIGHYFGA